MRTRSKEGKTKRNEARRREAQNKLISGAGRVGNPPDIRKCEITVEIDY